MTQRDFDRAMLVRYAVQEVGPRGSLEQMKAVCYCLRNRVRSGWGDWIDVIESAGEHSGNEPLDYVPIDTSKRAYQRLLHEVDDIYFGASTDFGAEGLDLAYSLCQQGGEALYWMFLDRPIRQWFQDTIASDLENHPSRVTMGLMMFFE